MKRGFLLSAVALLVVSMTLPLACGKAREGQAPTLSMGDEWTYQLVSGGMYYTATYRVEGEATVNGQDCWVIEAIYDPPIGGIESQTARVDKANWFTLQNQLTGSAIGLEYTISETISQKILSGSFWPLEIGKELKAEETSTKTTRFGGETETGIETLIVIREVEAIEEITVAAGRFRCFRIHKYDESGSESATYWYSDKTKYYVKWVGESQGNEMTLELESYSA